MSELQVVCAVIEHDGCFLIAQRAKDGIAPYVWEFPGGKVEANETHEEACIREIKEELSLDIVIDGFICDLLDDAFTPMVHVYAYKAHIVGGDMVLHNHEQVRFVEAKDVFSYNFQEADEKILRLLNDGYNNIV